MKQLTYPVSEIMIIYKIYVTNVFDYISFKLKSCQYSVFHTFSSNISAPSNNFHFKFPFWGMGNANQANAQVLLLNSIIFSYCHVIYDP